MTPQQLHDLERIYCEEPERFSACLEAAAAACGPAQGAMSTSYLSAVYMPARFWEEPSAEDNDDVEFLKTAINILIAAGARDVTDRITAMHPWFKPLAAMPEVTCPVQQALACLYLASSGHPAQVAHRTLRRNPWVVQAAADRLACLMLEFPVLAHPDFGYQVWSNEPCASSLLSAVVASTGARFPVADPAVSQATAQAWATHPIITAALNSPGPVPREGRRDQQSNGACAMPIWVFNITSNVDVVFASLLKLDRLRVEAGFGRPGVALSGLQSLDPVECQVVERRVHAGLASKLNTMWRHGAAYATAQALVDAGRRDKDDFQHLARPSDSFLDELRMSPTVKAASVSDGLLNFAFMIAEELEEGLIQAAPGVDFAPRHAAAIRVDEWARQFAAGGVYESPQAAASALHHELFVSDSYQPQVLSIDAMLSDSAAQALILAFEPYGIPASESRAQLEKHEATCGMWAPNLLTAARAICAAQSMTAILSATEPVAATKTAPRLGI